MRMWKVDPKLLCNKHLLGEHVEMHMFVGTIRRGKSIKGFVETGLVEVHSIKERHAELGAEMVRRGFTHKSPLPDYRSHRSGRVDVKANIVELSRRCPQCRKRIRQLAKAQATEAES